MYIVFYSTSDVFLAEEKLKNKRVECQVVPTPVTDKAYCGVCLKLKDDSDLEEIKSLEYERIEE